MLSATNHGPSALADLNHTALSHAQNRYVPYGPAGRRLCDPVFDPYAIVVPGMSTNFGWPSYFAVNVAWARCTAVVCGICRSRTASCASTVRAIQLRTPPIGESGGICWNDAGSESGRANVHGPRVDELLNQRPAIRR